MKVYFFEQGTFLLPCSPTSLPAYLLDCLLTEQIYCKFLQQMNRYDIETLSNFKNLNKWLVNIVKDAQIQYFYFL